MAHRILAIGLPKTGKTTYIVALWHTLETEVVPGSLVLDGIEGDVEYLEKLRERWLRRESLGRTRSGSEKTVVMAIRDPQSGTRGVLEIPDLAGETFRDQWVYRGWSDAFDEMARGCDALLVFLHPGTHSEPTLIEDVFAPEVLAVVEGATEDVPGTPPDEDGEGSASEWDPEQAPTSVQLVEVLQFLQREVLPVDRPVRTALVVSAWDSVPQRPKTTPAVWIQQRAPLLDQFLRANASAFAVRPYGVSAQGGDITDAATLKRLRDADEPTDPVVVVDGAHKGNDLTRPIRWLLGIDEGKL